MKEFVSAARAQNGSDDLIEFSLDGKTLHAHLPTEGQLAIAMTYMANDVDETEAVGGLMTFFLGLLDAPSAKYIRKRMNSREDPVDFDTVQQIIEYLVEQWTARPTKSPSDFMPSQTPGGRKSTARRHSRGSTPSNSVPIASAT